MKAGKFVIAIPTLEFVLYPFFDCFYIDKPA